MSKNISLFKTIVARSNSMCSLQIPNAITLRIRWFSISSKDDERKPFVVSYLKNSLNFSHEVALLTSKYVNFDSPDKPNKAIEFLRINGFNQTQIAKLVRGFPEVLLLDTQKIIFPKFEFLKAKGISEVEMAKMLSYFPRFLRSSLNDKIIPSYDYLRNFIQCDQRTINAVKRYPEIIGRQWNNVVANATVLQEHGVPDIHIAYWIEYQPRSFVVGLDQFRDAIEKVSKMGFNASRGNFATAVRMFVGISKSTWESKIKMFRNCGLSEADVSKIFRVYPKSMSYSEQKISEIMKFFINEMNWKPSIVATYPSILGLSLKNRIIPRCSVHKILLSKGLVNGKVNLILLLSVSEERFLQKYVEQFDKDAPELLKLYNKQLKSLKQSCDR